MTLYGTNISPRNMEPRAICHNQSLNKVILNNIKVILNRVKVISDDNDRHRLKRGMIMSTSLEVHFFP